MGTDYFIDTHAHIDGDEFLEDLDEVVIRAKESNVKKIFIPNINAESIERIKRLCTTNAGVLFPMIGLHPEDVKPGYEQILGKMEEELKSPNRYIAIGEVGLDYYWDDTHKDIQKDALKKQIHWALKYNLPLMLHTRSAHNDMVDILSKTETETPNAIKGVFHCFAGNEEEATELLRFENFMLGIGGIVTFKKSSLPQTIKNTIPLKRIVLETDSPYMAPAPNRGKRNESAYIKDIATKLADIYGCSTEEIMTQTTINALNIFTKAT